jgi:hypothetical protein
VVYNDHQALGAVDGQSLSVECHLSDLRVVDPERSSALSTYFVLGPELTELRLGTESSPVSSIKR